MPPLSETAIVMQLRKLALYACPRVHLVAVPNGAKRTVWQAAQAKREGMATGFPDLIALAPGKVAFLEIKTAKGRVSEAQGEWLDRITACGFPCGVFHSADDALAFLRTERFPFIGERA